MAGSSNAPSGKWTPYQGDEIEALIRYKGFTDQTGNISEPGEKVIGETFRIMEMCGNPTAAANTDTGLVIGYVQSGKTLSFTSVAALAKDNYYRLVIIIAGTSVPLSEQSSERVKKDLRYDDRYDRKWTVIKNASSADDRSTIKLKLDQWNDPAVSNDECSTILLTVMKNSKRLRGLTAMLRQLTLSGVPTLIIDDESDQASLNTRASANANDGIAVNEGEASVIYTRINELRDLFDHHTFLQYTATPQANLFINILDRLSPNFIKLLTPGKGYTGGKAFFIEHPELVRVIPATDIPSNQNVVTEPPATLGYALRIYFLGVAAGEIKNDGNNRSMMVHPSRLTGTQALYMSWIRNIRNSWVRLLESNDDDEKSELILEFKAPYDDLKKSVGEDLPSFSELTTRLLHAMKHTMIKELNASRGKTPSVSWRDFYSHILVGGQAMDRGFTVEGLTVTYMPRSLGTGQVDTTLQRARFFGYKGSYLGYCRVWLDDPTIMAYREIIQHEEDVRQRLLDFDINNKPLNNWERQAVLDSMLNLTRPNIIYNDLYRDYLGNDWFYVKTPHDTPKLIEPNSKIVASFLDAHKKEFKTDEGDILRTEDQRNLVANVSMKICLSDLLNQLKFTLESDSQTYSSIRSLMSGYLINHPNEQCAVYVMTSKITDGEVDQKVRNRRLGKNNTEVQQLFQGRNDKTKYPGGRAIRKENMVSIQIYRLHITDSNGNDIKDSHGNTLFQDVPTIAIWMPRSIGKDLIGQDDNNS